MDKLIVGVNIGILNTIKYVLFRQFFGKFELNIFQGIFFLLCYKIFLLNHIGIKTQALKIIEINQNEYKFKEIY